MLPGTKHQRLREKRRAEHRCLTCGKPLTSGKTQTCAVCLDKVKDRSKSRSNVTFQKRQAEGLCSRCGEPLTDNRRTCSTCLATLQRASQQLKAEVMAAYGGKCACCGESEIRFLSIDHINNDGATHRRTLKGSGKGSRTGVNIYRWLKKNAYPSGFQVLCFNCNMGKAHNNGVCPHRSGLGSIPRL